MSLVILSNQETRETDSDWDKPYSFNNSLKETMIIPANSEVALQSAKVNKSSAITITGRESFYECFGQDLDAKGNSLEIHETLMNPIRASIRSDNFRAEQSVSLDEFTKRVSDAMDRGLPHPDLIDNQECKIRLDSDNKFEGLDLVYTHGTTQADESNLPDITSISPWNLGMVTADGDEILDGDGMYASVVATGIKVLTPSVSEDVEDVREYGQYSIFQQNPLSLFEGEMRVDIDFVVTDTTDWVVDTPVAFGLSRSNQSHTIDPPDFNDDQNELNTEENIGNIQFYDYVIRLERTKADPTGDFFLWIGQSSISANAVPVHGGDEPVFTMREVEYYEWDTTAVLPAGLTKSAFTTRYNMTTNTLKINQFKFTANGENMDLWYHTGDKDDTDVGSGDANNGGIVGTWTILCSFSQSTEADWKKLNVLTGTDYASYKQNIPKPIGQYNWNMYPVIGSHSATIDRGVVLSKWGGRITTEANFNDVDRDYYIRSTETISGMSEMSAYTGRSMFLMGGGEVDPVYDYTYIMLKSASWGTTCGFNAILSPSGRYKYSSDANVRTLLGFGQDTLTHSTPPTIVGIISTYTGSVLPTFAVNNLFIRLNNFTQNSTNAGIGRPSKIIYTMPRFDNSGRETGTGLFFEPGERVYLALNNTEDLYVNDFDISIVDSREVLSRTLHGTTIICLHFRKQK